MQSFFLRKQPQLKAATQSQEAPSSSAEEASPALPWYTGQSKRQEEKSQKDHQERVERYHKIHDLAAKQVDVANIARQLGLSRQGVYTYLQMKQPRSFKKKDYLKRLCAIDQGIAQTCELIQTFTTMLREGQ
jgi:hypothetical protein